MQSGLKRFIELPESMEALGTDKFEGIFLNELHSISSDLPLDVMCKEGGWPDDDSLEVSIASIQDINGKTHIIVKCEFNEVVPTGCADIENSESGYGELEIVIDPKRKNAYFQCEEDDI